MQKQVPTQSNNLIHNIETITQIMVADFQQLNERARHNEQLAENRTNYYLAMVTASLTGLVFVYTSPEISSAFYLVAPILTFVVSVIGVLTIMQVVNFHEDATVFYRRAGRIRRWFFDLNPSILPYLPFLPTDDSPEFIKQEASLRRVEVTLVVLTVISFIAWGASLIATFIWVNQTKTWFGVISIAAWFIFGVVFYYSLKYVAQTIARQLQIKEKEALESGQIHFPSPYFVNSDTSQDTETPAVNTKGTKEPDTAHNNSK